MGLALGDDVYYPVFDFYNLPNRVPTIHKGKIVEIRKVTGTIVYSIQPYEYALTGIDLETHNHKYSDRLENRVHFIDGNLIYQTKESAIYNFGLLGIKIANAMFKTLDI